MPVGDCERAFIAAAAADGLPLVRARAPWLNQRGHLGLPPGAEPVRRALADIFAALDGDPVSQSRKRLTALPGDFVHEPTGTFIELDESQHFTSYRLLTFDHYPADARLGFDMDEYRALCREWSPRSDKYRASKPAVGFGPGGRQRQRAYHDALRDLVIPAVVGRPLVRVQAPYRDGTAAYQRVRHRLLAAIE
ncbi:hypothetical protein H9657_12855 [Cellulomonas sp. Sa3CUA2]|uniref:Uncharacterized protein n=1 Tax=Cellulomonas avistercoris TaxID=2762242 RepID=A0ABR8QFF7_9CELL|nr:hypothetical protein [Cellulomonas avistercoris]MBD7919161.1 hypothetical protein [Cellulomonas avistercoris]